MLLDHNEWMAYWEELATKYRPIGHNDKQKMAFARVIDSSRSPFQPFYYTKEFDESLRDDIHFPCLIAESTRERYNYRQGMQAYYSCGIVILDRAEKKDYDGENEAVDACKKHCRALVGKLMNYLQENPEQGHIDKSTLLIHPIGPLRGDKWGARAEWVMRKSAGCDFIIDENLWKTTSAEVKVKAQ